MVFLILKVNIPSLNCMKALKIDNNERIYKFKNDIIKKCGKNDTLLNYGLLLYVDEQPSVFLREAKTLADYNIDEKSKLEFTMKRRLNIDESDVNFNTLSTKLQKKFIEEIQKKLYDRITERLNKNFDPNFCSETGETPLTIAIQNNDIEAFNILVKNGALVDFRMSSKYNWMTPLHYAITIRNREMIWSLIKEGACVDEFDIRGYTPLYLAVTNDENEYIKLLALATSNFNVADTNGNGLLHQAIKNKNTHALTLLIDMGADMNLSNNDGNTALHLSVLTNNKEMVRKLVIRGCNREIINNDGKTAKGIAGLKGFTDIFEFLTNFNNTLIEPPPPPFEDKEKMISDILDESSIIVNNNAALMRKGTMKSEIPIKKLNSIRKARRIKKKRKVPPPPPLPLFDLKDLILDELDDNKIEINESQGEDNKEENINENMLSKKNFDMMVNIIYDMLRIINVKEKNVKSMEDYQSRIEKKLNQQKFEYSNYKLLKTVDEDNAKKTAIEPGNRI